MEQMEQMEQSVQVLDYKDFVLFHDTEHCKNNTRVCPSIQSQQNRLCSVTEHNKRQSVTVTQCPKWLVRRLQPVPFIFAKKKPSRGWVKLLPLELLNIFTDLNKNATGFFSVSDF